YDPRRPVRCPVQRTSSPLLLHDGLEVRRTIRAVPCVVPYNGLRVRCRCTTDWKSVVRSASYDLRRTICARTRPIRPGERWSLNLAAVACRSGQVTLQDA
ncbi:MAG: hypothetical protein ACKOU6_19060, partial [Planctomycetota bacterium]